MFYGTVRHNLFSDKNDEDLIRVLKVDYLDLDRVVSFDGHNLSGGEIQRLSLAILLLRTSANIWILVIQKKLWIYLKTLRIHSLLQLMILIFSHALTKLSS